jgi:hypothetical protein
MVSPRGAGKTNARSVLNLSYLPTKHTVRSQRRIAWQDPWWTARTVQAGDIAQRGGAPSVPLGAIGTVATVDRPNHKRQHKKLRLRLRRAASRSFTFSTDYVFHGLGERGRQEDPTGRQAFCSPADRLQTLHGCGRNRATRTAHEHSPQ